MRVIVREARGETAWTPGYHARLSLEFERRGARTVLVRRRHRGPLFVQRGFYPEGDRCHIYLLHPPGGLVAGDTLAVRVRVHPGAEVLCTTPAAGKIYRSHALLCRQRQTVAADNGAVVEWLPQETILFEGARADLATRVHLSGDARFIGWDIVSLGRAACGERFADGRLRQAFELSRDGQPLRWERATFDGGAPLLDAPWGLGRHRVCGVFIATVDQAGLASDLRARLPTASGRFVVSEFETLLLARYLGDSVAEVRRLFFMAWDRVRQATLGRGACAPRIWNT